MVSYQDFVNTFSVYTTQLKTKAIKHNEIPTLSSTVIPYLISPIPHMAGSRTANKNKTTPLNYWPAVLNQLERLKWAERVLHLELILPPLRPTSSWCLPIDENVAVVGRLFLLDYTQTFNLPAHKNKNSMQYILHSSLYLLQLSTTLAIKMLY